MDKGFRSGWVQHQQGWAKNNVKCEDILLFAVLGQIFENVYKSNFNNLKMKKSNELINIPLLTKYNSNG